MSASRVFLKAIDPDSQPSDGIHESVLDLIPLESSTDDVLQNMTEGRSRSPSRFFLRRKSEKTHGSRLVSYYTSVSHELLFGGKPPDLLGSPEEHEA